MPEHPAYARWLADVLLGGEPFAVSTLVLSGFIRLVTNRRIFKEPTPLDDALMFCDSLCEWQNVKIIAPSLHHWDLFARLCKATHAAGKLVPDAYFAALAIEHNCTWVTSDDDFRRFPGLKWRRPFDDHVTTNP